MTLSQSYPLLRKINANYIGLHLEIPLVPKDIEICKHNYMTM